MKISFIISRIWFNIYLIASCTSGWIRRIVFHKRYESRDIMISCDAEPNLGDLVLGINLIRDLNHFCIKEKRKLYVFCTIKNINFLKRLLGEEAVSIIFLPILPDGKAPQINELKVVRKELKKYSFDICLHGFISFSVASNYVCLTARCNKCYNVYPFKKQKANNLVIYRRNYLKRLFTKSGYAPNKLRCNQILASLAGVTDSKSRIYKLNANHPIKRTKNSYITLTVDSSWTGRRWSMKLWAELAESLHNLNNNNIVLLGIKVDDEEFTNAFSGIVSEKWIVNKIGSTTLEEMFDIISGSLFHVGVDSGSIHFAASLGTPSFCLTGYWDGYTYLPYDIDEQICGTAAPFVIRRSDIDAEELPCFGCNSQTGLMGLKNASCAEKLVNGHTCECLKRLTLQDVITSIKQHYDDIIKELPDS